jgi:hypothetical protein
MTEMLNQDSRPQDGHGLTREAWLHRAIEAFRPRFTQIGLPLPAKLHVSVGFGYSTRAESKYILGQCWARRASADGVNHIFLGPQEGDPAGMLVSLLHELIHAADDCASGHKGVQGDAAANRGNHRRHRAVHRRDRQQHRHGQRPGAVAPQPRRQLLLHGCAARGRHDRVERDAIVLTWF